MKESYDVLDLLICQSEMNNLQDVAKNCQIEMPMCENALQHLQADGLALLYTFIRHSLSGKRMLLF